MTTRISLHALCRDLAVIDNPTFIRGGMKAIHARDAEIEHIALVIKQARQTLDWLRNNEGVVRAAVSPKKQGGDV